MHGWRLEVVVVAVAAAFACALAPAPAHALNLTINTAEDGDDDDLTDPSCDSDSDPGDQCSQRAAILQINHTANATNTLTYAPGLTTISPSPPLPPITVPVSIDGTVNQGKVEITGTPGAASGNGLTFNVNGPVTVRRMIVSYWDTGYLALDGQYDLKGIESRNNDMNGVEFTGGRANSVIGGNAAADRNVWSGNNQNGMKFSSTLNAVNWTILGNYAGLNPAGTAAEPNLLNGMQIDADNLTIGGGVGDALNILSGNTQDGALVNGDGNTIRRTLLGPGPALITYFGNRHGANIPAPATNNVIGAGTVIAGNSQDGVNWQGDNRIGISPRIFDNGRNLFRFGAVYDAPFLAQVLAVANNDLNVSGTLSSPAGQSRTIHVFANPGSNPGGAGEIFLGAQTFPNPSGGTFNWNFNVPDPGTGLPYINATATGTGTSNFSNEVLVQRSSGSQTAGGILQGAPGNASAQTDFILPTLRAILGQDLGRATGNVLINGLPVNAPAAGVAGAQFFTDYTQFLDPQSASASATPAAKRRKRRKPVLIASGRRNFTAPGRGTIKFKLTRNGKRLARRARRVRTTARLSFTPTGSSKVTVSRKLRVNLRRKKAKRK